MFSSFCWAEALRTTSPHVKFGVIDSARCVGLFRELAGLDPIHCVSAVIDGDSSMWALANRDGHTGDEPRDMFIMPHLVCAKLGIIARSWKLEGKTRIKGLASENDVIWTFLTGSDATSIDGKPWLLFQAITTVGGNATGDETLKFVAVSLLDGTSHALEYVGSPEFDPSTQETMNIQGVFRSFPPATPASLRKILEAQAATSPLIHRPSTEDQDYDLPRNYSKRWYLDNGEAFEEAKEVDPRRGLQGVIRWKSYPEASFPKAQDQNGDIRIENTRYKVVAHWRGPVIAFDKKSRVYFPVWGEGCLRGCDLELQFAGPDHVRIQYELFDRRQILVDLATGAFEVMPGEGPP